MSKKRNHERVKRHGLHNKIEDPKKFLQNKTGHRHLPGKDQIEPQIKSQIKLQIELMNTINRIKNILKTAPYKTGCLACLLFFGGIATLNAQEEAGYTVKANIIYYFSKYINWPKNAKNNDFIIGVIGRSHVYDKLKKNIKNKKVGDQKIIIRKYSSAAPSFNCHILFISEEESGNLKKIAIRTAGSCILLVSESEGLGQKGACINFITVSDHLKMEINKCNIEERNLLIASDLLRLGTIVN